MHTQNKKKAEESFLETFQQCWKKEKKKAFEEKEIQIFSFFFFVLSKDLQQMSEGEEGERGERYFGMLPGGLFGKGKAYNEKEKKFEFSFTYKMRIHFK